jgi:hypothetical protein
MTPPGWILMLSSLVFVWSLTLRCLWKVFTRQESAPKREASMMPDSRR